MLETLKSSAPFTPPPNYLTTKTETMKEFRLINMTDFVLQVVQTPNINEAICWEQTRRRLDKIYQYSLFLKQPLKLEMFVPCDEYGNVLEQPCEIMEIKGCRHCACREYLKAKEKVLFEGFRILDNEEQVFCTLGIGKLIITYDYKTKTFLLQKDWTVERLVRFSLILTPTALKQIQQ